MKSLKRNHKQKQSILGILQEENPKEPVPKFLMGYKISQTGEGQGIFDNNMENFEKFTLGSYVLPLQNQYYFYKQHSRLLVSKTPSPTSQSQIKLIFWIIIKTIQRDGVKCYQFHFKKPQHLRKMIKQRSENLIAARKHKQSLFISGQKYKDKDEKQSSHPKLLKRTKYFDQPYSDYIPQPPPTDIDNDICLAIGSEKQYPLEIGTTLLFGRTIKAMSGGMSKSVEYKISGIKFHPGYTQVDYKQVTNNKNLHINNQKYLLYEHDSQNNEEERICLFCSRKCRNQTIEETILEICYCKNENNICLLCISHWTDQMLKKGTSFSSFFNDGDYQQLSFQKEIKCKLCKHPYPQYVCIVDKDQPRYFKIITRHKTSQLIFQKSYDYNKKQSIQKSVYEDSQLRIGNGPDTWLQLPNLDFTSENHATMFLRDQKLFIKDWPSRYGTFIKEQDPVLCFSANELGPLSIQIDSISIDFRLEE